MVFLVHGLFGADLGSMPGSSFGWLNGSIGDPRSRVDSSGFAWPGQACISNNQGEKGRNSSPSLVKNAMRSYRRGRFKSARRQFARVLKRYPHNQEALLGLSKTYVELGKHESAVFIAKKLLRRAPRNAQAWLIMADALQSLRRRSSALRSYQRYLQLAPNGRYAGQVRTIIKRLKGLKR